MASGPRHLPAPPIRPGALRKASEIAENRDVTSEKSGFHQNFGALPCFTTLAQQNSAVSNAAHPPGPSVLSFTQLMLFMQDLRSKNIWVKKSAIVQTI